MLMFEYMGINFRFYNVFYNGMNNYFVIVLKRILEIYSGFIGFLLLIDIGGGIGDICRMIFLKYFKIKGINFDFFYVIINVLF